MRKVLFVCLVALLVLGAQADRSLLKKRKKKAKGAGTAVLLEGVVQAGITQVKPDPLAAVDPQLLIGGLPASTPLWYAGVAYGPDANGNAQPYAQVTLINWEYAISAFNAFYVFNADPSKSFKIPTNIIINLGTGLIPLNGVPAPNSQSRSVPVKSMWADSITGIVVFKVQSTFGFQSNQLAQGPISLPSASLTGPVNSALVPLAVGSVVSLASFQTPTQVVPPPTGLTQLTEATVAYLGLGVDPGTIRLGGVITGAGPVAKSPANPNSADTGSIAFQWGTDGRGNNGGGLNDVLVGIYNNAAGAPNAVYIDLSNCAVRQFIGCNAQTGYTNAINGVVAQALCGPLVGACPGNVINP